MGTVYIGGASIDERGKISGGKAGNQSGKELVCQKWYLHSKGWRVFRHPDENTAKKIAACMAWAISNKHIGYDQSQRNTLYNACKDSGFDVSKVTKDVETDCSALVRVCCAYAGVEMTDFNTSSEASELLSCGFKEMTGLKYTASSAYLCQGDILVTKTKGHTVVVLIDGDKAEHKIYKLGDRVLRNGCKGADVTQLQTALISLGYSCGDWGADGEYGDCTELAVVRLQTDSGVLVVNGEFNAMTYEYLLAMLSHKVVGGVAVKIVHGNAYVRTEPRVDADKRGTALRDDLYKLKGEAVDDRGVRWHMIDYKGRDGWVSSKYSEVV